MLRILTGVNILPLPSVLNSTVMPVPVDPLSSCVRVAVDASGRTNKVVVLPVNAVLPATLVMPTTGASSVPCPPVETENTNGEWNFKVPLTPTVSGFVPAVISIGL